MKFFDKKSAVRAYYYIMSIDGEITPDEQKDFDRLCIDVGETTYEECFDEWLSGCKDIVENALGKEECFDIIQEAVDAALDESDGTKNISTRMVIWDMLVLSFADGEYSKNEERLLRHLVRVTGLDESVFAEMILHIKAARDIEDELEALNASDKPYKTIRPIVEEIEKRQQVILTSVMNLIEDEVVKPVVDEVKEKNFIESAAGAVVDVAGSVGSAAVDIGGKAVDAVGGFFKGIFG